VDLEEIVDIQNWMPGSADMVDEYVDLAKVTSKFMNIRD
jgi:hypothetical protein